MSMLCALPDHICQGHTTTVFVCVKYLFGEAYVNTKTIKITH